MKKTISVLICVLVFLQLLPMTVFAGDGGCVYATDRGGKPGVAYRDGQDETVTIPLTISGNKITRIISLGFYRCENLKHVIIPEGIEEIGDSAFLFCSNLESVELPESLKIIGDRAFQGCTNLKSIVIPAGVQHIGESIFCEDSLDSICVAEGNTYYDSRNNCNAIIEKSNKFLIAGCVNTFIPEGVAGISDFAFSGCEGLKKINIPVSMRYIQNGAFNYCPLERIDYAGTIEEWKKINVEGGIFGPDYYSILDRNLDIIECPVYFAKKAKVKISLKPDKVTYNKKVRHIDSVQEEENWGSITYCYYMDKACKKLTTPKETGCKKKGGAPKYAGIYYVKAKMNANDYYASSVSKAVKLEIQPRVTEYKYIKKNGSYYLGVQLDGIQKSVKTYYMKLYTSKKDKPLKTTGKYNPTKRAATKPAAGFKKGQKYYVKIFFKGKNRKLSPLVLFPKRFSH